MTNRVSIIHSGGNTSHELVVFLKKNKIYGDPALVNKQKVTTVVNINHPEKNMQRYDTNQILGDLCSFTGD